MDTLRSFICLPHAQIHRQGQLECLAVERLVNIFLNQDYVFPPEPR